MEKVLRLRNIQKILIIYIIYMIIGAYVFIFRNLEFVKFIIVLIVYLFFFVFAYSYEIHKDKIIQINLFKKNRVIYFSSISIEDFKDEKGREKFNISFISEDRQKPFELEMNKKWGKKIYCFLKDMNVKIVFKNKERKWHCD